MVGPETLQLNLQNACNTRCIFCWNHSPLLAARPPGWHRQRLSDVHLDGILQSLPRLRPSRVLLSGRGEPLLHPGVEGLLERLAELAIPATVQTNGIDGPTPARLAELAVDHLLINLSAGTATGYERSHPGCGGRFERIVERLEQLADAATVHRPRRTLVAVVQRTNVDQLEPLVELAARTGAEAAQLRGMEMAAGLEQLALTGSWRDRARAALQRAVERAATLGVALDGDHLRRVLDDRDGGRRFSADLARGPCFMGWYYLRVTCDGRVMFCCKDKLVDHLDRRTLHSIWRSAGYHLLRIAGRDGDDTAGLFDDKCSACSNVLRNQQVHDALVRLG